MFGKTGRIDADKLIAEYDRVHIGPPGGARKLMEEAPTADVAEVKRGKWIEKEEVYGDVYYTCSNCNNDWTTIDGTPQENFMNYCPNCGAKMDGGKI